MSSDAGGETPLEGAPAQDELIGAWILDQYRVEKLIGEGGMGRIYLADQVALERKVAIKVLRVHDREARSRFRNEARAASRLSHPNIITVYNFGELADGALFLAMEYLEGPSLYELLVQSGALPLARAIDIAAECANALACAHNRGIVHRDFKPLNVMLSGGPQGAVKVVDFGVARLIEESGATPTGVVVGTPQYLSPEQCRGELAVAASDQYALGLVLYEMLAGRPAFTAETALRYLYLHQFETFPPPSQVRREPHIELIEPVLLRMTAKDPAQRYPGLREARRALEQAKRDLDVATGMPVRRVSSSPGKSELPLPRDISHARRMRVARASLKSSKHLLSDQDKDALLEKNVRVYFESKLKGKKPDELWIVGAAEDDWDSAREECREAGVSPQRVLTCVDAPVESKTATGAIARLNHVLISPHPVPPEPIAVALRWIDGGHRLSLLESGTASAVQFVQISGTHLKSYVIDSLVEDLDQQLVRSSVKYAVTAIAEEMIMNAIFHAPVDLAGKKRFAHLDRGRPVMLEPEAQAVLRWVFDEHYVALSVRDPFGSMSAADIVGALCREAPVAPDPSTVSAGLGLQIMRRAACHLFIAVLPGESCEIVALVERERSEASHRRRSLCVLQGYTEGEEKIGDRLYAREIRAASMTRLELRGEINESADLSSIFSRRGIVWLDLGGVTAINSSGVVAWMRANASRNPDLHLIFERCSPPLVYQFNMIRHLPESGEVVSILVPYYCPACGKEVVKRVEVTDVDAAFLSVHDCPACGKPLELEDPPEHYFGFLKQPS